MASLPPNYPRKTVRIAVEHLRRNAMAVVKMAERDEVIILRCGRPRWVIVHHDYYRMLAIRAGTLKASRGTRSRVNWRSNRSRRPG